MVIDFTDLVVLIGTNPLPNYVVIKYFLKENKHLQRIWLVCSDKTPLQAGTSEFANNIKEVIEAEFEDTNIDFEFHQVSLRNVGSGYWILNDLESKLEPLIPPNCKLHMNYTGGTKSMAVHTYQYFHGEYGGECSFSYLDGRDFKLKFDDDSNYETKDLKYEVGISLEKLFELHSCEKKGKQINPSYIKTIEEFEKIINADKLNEYLNWKDKYIRGIYYEGKFINKKRTFLKHNKLLNDQDIEQFRINFKNGTSDTIINLLRTLPVGKSIMDDNGDIWIPDEYITNNEYLERLKTTIEDFLDGKWLEVYVNYVITRGIESDEILKELYNEGIIAIKDNLEIIKKSSGKNFEIDVILLNGYQVCGISCTTSSKESLCKSKCFEIMHRVKQIGGEEAKSILITCMEKDIKSFYEDLKDISGSGSHELIVLGLEDLKSSILWEKVREHIWGDDL